jgi:phosphate transport system substrate-binding protein
VAALLSDKRFASRKLLLLGFTDNSGNQAANKKISKERAKAIAAELAQRGVQAQLAVGLGSVMPVSGNDTDQGRDKNRRVEAWIAGGE